MIKVFADCDLDAGSHSRASALSNETYSFQVAYRSERLLKGISVHAEGSLASVISIRQVGLVPAEMLNYFDHDAHVVRVTPGLYPDPLYPHKKAEGAVSVPGQWRSVWITVSLDLSVTPGVHPIKIIFTSAQSEELAQADFELEVLPGTLPEQQLVHTEWFHADCLATYYNVNVFSDRHWELIDNYLQTYVRYGGSMILTPLFTLPLDTAPGLDRPTVQLVQVEITGDNRYRFDFSLLEKWVELCNRRGIRHFEFSHLFTQWGAKHAPKVIAFENGEEKKIFGWETDSTGEPYKQFLGQLLPELMEFIRKHRLQDRCYFHISDEPKLEHLAEYESASDLMREHLDGLPILDALSAPDFYVKGLVHTPIPPTNHADDVLPIVEGERWTYYCCDQYKEVSNRFFSMPSSRNRIIGMQLYKYEIHGFLHWGFNFWYSQFSRKAVDPFKITDSDYGFPSGDAYLVYPGEDGLPIDSMRLLVFHEGLQDLRALRLLESLVGREQTVAILEEDLAEPLTFAVYPREDEWLIRCRERINAAIKSHLPSVSIS
nr:DUF4091 domain-containing protein [Paenibacillus pasadenensis]